MKKVLVLLMALLTLSFLSLDKMIASDPSHYHDCCCTDSSGYCKMGASCDCLEKKTSTVTFKKAPTCETTPSSGQQINPEAFKVSPFFIKELFSMALFRLELRPYVVYDDVVLAITTPPPEQS